MGSVTLTFSALGSMELVFNVYGFKNVTFPLSVTVYL